MEYKKGTFYILKINDEKKVREKKGFKIFGVRYTKFLPDGWVHKKECTPSKELLMFCKNLEKNKSYEPDKYPGVKITKEADRYLKENQTWDEFVFKNVYLPNYVDSIQHKSAKREINKIIRELENGGDVYYACYCANEKICHRRIMAAIIKKQGYKVDTI